VSRIPNGVIGVEDESCDTRSRRAVDPAFADYYRCPPKSIGWENADGLPEEKAFFFFEESLAYGRCNGHIARRPAQAVQAAIAQNSKVLPFELNEVIDNLRLEQYVAAVAGAKKRCLDSAWLNRAYYSLRPMLPVMVRKHLQKIHLTGWRDIAFPSWPIDTTVDNMMQSAMRLALRQNPENSIPFIWFWPDAHPACALVTHDIEHDAGRGFALNLLAVDESFGIKSSFQVVPEGRYDSVPELVAAIQKRGFEVNVHDFNHDGLLFSDRALFLRRAEKINEYAKNYGAKGFRSGSMYRKADWLCELEFLYDMSVPNAAHLEPQRGGCCTIMPYKIGNLIELPLTVTQDYSLLHIFNEYSTDLWKQEIAYLIRKNGLVNIIVHPDYVIEERALSLYRDLLKYLVELRDQRKLWIPIPGEAARWWSARDRMTLEWLNGKWVARGEGSDRATVAYACLDEGQLVYKVGDQRMIASTESSCVVQSK